MLPNFSLEFIATIVLGVIVVVLGAVVVFRSPDGGR
jgi:hypothetical protein